MIKFKELPIEIQERMLECQAEQWNPRDENVFIEDIDFNSLGGGFSWGKTKEGSRFWTEIIRNGNINHFYTVYPKKESNFEKGDKVFDIDYGWGDVVSVCDKKHTKNTCVCVHYLTRSPYYVFYSQKGKNSFKYSAFGISFTQYDEYGNGVSRVRPKKQNESKTLDFEIPKDKKLLCTISVGDESNPVPVFVPHDTDTSFSKRYYFVNGKNENLKQTDMNKKYERFPFKLSLEDAKKITMIAYENSESKIKEWKENLSLKLMQKWIFSPIEDFIIDQDLYKQMREHCTKEQQEILDEIFGKDEKDWFPGELYWVKDNDSVALKYAHKNYREFINLKPFTLYGFKGMAFPFKHFIKADGVKLPEL